MNLVARRLAAIALGGALTVGSLSSCGILGGSAVDCAQMSSEMLDVSNNIGKPGFDDAVKALKEEGESIDDTELKGALDDYIKEVEATDKQMKDLENGDVSGESPDISKMQKSTKTFEKKCSAL